MAKTFTAEELLAYDGSDPDKPVYIAVQGAVFDVSASREFYGKGGPYEAFAGHECSRALAIMKVEASECNDNLADCSEKQLKTLADWVAKFNSKYTVVGKLHMGDMPDEAYPLLPTSPLPPFLAVTMIVVLLLTAVGAYILYLDMLGPPAEGAHTEL